MHQINMITLQVKMSWPNCPIVRLLFIFNEKKLRSFEPVYSFPLKSLFVELEFKNIDWSLTLPLTLPWSGLTHTLLTL